MQGTESDGVTVVDDAASPALLGEVRALVGPCGCQIEERGDHLHIQKGSGLGLPLRGEVGPANRSEEMDRAGHQQDLSDGEAGGKDLYYTPRSLRRAVSRHAEALGLHCTPHTLRRTFGRELWRQGCPLETIQQLYGHSDLDTTILYLGIKDSDLDEAIARFSPKMYRKGHGQP